MRYDVVIIGAGAAGFACALTLGSANDKFDWAKDKKYLILDDNKSDLNVGKYFNVAGVDSGINGVDLLLKMKKQLEIYKDVELKDEKATKIENLGEYFKITTENSTFEASIFCQLLLIVPFFFLTLAIIHFIFSFIFTPLNKSL